MNLENLNLVELNAQEVKEVEGGKMSDADRDFYLGILFGLIIFL